MKTILLALDPSIFRYGLQHIIATLAVPTRIVPADTPEAAGIIIDAGCFDLLITDLHPDVWNAVRVRCPDMKILIYTAADEKRFAIDYLLAGADGYLSRSAKREEMEYAVRTVLSGEKYISGPVRQDMLNKLLHLRNTGRKGHGVY
jgi:DNA-binding NarL/FixJ family response regulator